MEYRYNNYIPNYKSQYDSKGKAIIVLFFYKKSIDV